MRIAIVSDIHGNMAAFEAVVEDLRETSPDLILHGGDLANGGSSPVGVVDRIREFGWPGVLGNGDEMLAAPESLAAFANQVPAMQTLLPLIERMAAATRDRLGPERLVWLGSLPLVHACDPFTLVHASPESCWNSPSAEAPDAELEAVYQPLGKPIAVYGHIHCPFIRNLSGLTVINTGSASQSYDGDRRASYLLLDGGIPVIRRVEYDLDRELAALSTCGLPHSDWMARILEGGKFVMP